MINKRFCNQRSIPFAALTVVTFIQLADCCANSGYYTEDLELRRILDGTARLEGPIKSTSGGFVQSATDLRCDDWSYSCRWRNERGSDLRPEIDELDWGRATGRPNPLRLNQIAGTMEWPGGPDGRWLITGSPRLHNVYDSALLVSDPIACQIGNGELRFRYWTSPGAQIRVCRRPVNAGKNYDYCSSPISGGSPGPATVFLPGGPSTNVGPFGGFPGQFGGSPFAQNGQFSNQFAFPGNGQFDGQYSIDSSIYAGGQAFSSFPNSFNQCNPPPCPINPIQGQFGSAFEIVIVASGFTYNLRGIRGGLAIIDDLDYNARLCNAGYPGIGINPGINYPGINPGINPTYPISVPNLDACQPVSCNLDPSSCIQNLLRTNWKTGRSCWKFVSYIHKKVAK